MWLLIFVAITLFLVVLPLLPSFIELSVASDVKPLRVVQEYDSNIKHFAFGFKNYLEKNFSNFFTAPEGFNTGIKEGSLRGGTDFQIIGNNGAAAFSSKENLRHATSRLIISSAPLVLPEGMKFDTEIYGKAGVEANPRCQFRAILAEGDIVLAQDCVVLRWIHSNTWLTANSGCQLYGRCSAENTIRLADNVRFERLHAVKTMFGNAAPQAAVALASAPRTMLSELKNVKNHFERRWLVSGNVTIPANSDFDGDIVASGSVTLEENVSVRGSIKSNGELRVGSGSEITGSLISTTHIYIEEQCRVNGPVIAEASVHVEAGSVIGSLASPVTVNAPVIHFTGGALVFGTVWASVEGMVLPAPQKPSGPRV